MALRETYRTRACGTCGELNTHGVICDNPNCSNQYGPLVEVVLKVVFVAGSG